MLTETQIRTKTGVFLTAGWHNLAMLNFPVEPSLLEPYLPAGTELDFWQGRPYLSVVGFQFVNAAALGMPLLFHRQFEEVNLRFYVIRPMPDGARRGVVFIREIAPKRLISVAARWFYNEQYVTMPMRHRVEEGLVQYEWWHSGRWNGMSVRTGASPQPLAVGTEEEFIAEHYWGYSKQQGGGTIEYEVEHSPWRVAPATSATYDCDVEAIYGKPFVPYLREPTSAFVADGSPIIVRRGLRL
jgi:uncharacterized protein